MTRLRLYIRLLCACIALAAMAPGGVAFAQAHEPAGGQEPDQPPRTVVFEAWLRPG